MLSGHSSDKDSRDPNIEESSEEVSLAGKRGRVVIPPSISNEAKLNWFLSLIMWLWLIPATDLLLS